MATSPRLRASQKAAYNKPLVQKAIMLAEQSVAPTFSTSVGKPSQRALEFDKLRELPRALMSGTEAMREKGETYLPRHEAESNETYQMRLKGVTLYNAFEQTVNAQAGKLFAEPVSLNDDVPETLMLFSQNVDGQGRALSPYAFDLLRESMVDGVAFIFVDFPALKQADGSLPKTYADQKAVGARPIWIPVLASQLIGWKTESILGQQVLSQARILERTYEPKEGEPFEEVLVERVRVLERGSYAVYVADKTPTGQKFWRLESEGATTLDFIPLVPVYTNRTGFFEGEPPLRTLAELNREHWISSSEQRHALTFARFAMLGVTGADDTTPNVVVGPNKVLRGGQGTAFSYVEPTGNGIRLGAEDLLAIEKRMGSAGMQIRVENAGQVTATSAAIDSAESNAALRAVAESLADSINTALWYTALYLGLPDGGTVDVYDDFAEAPPQGTVGELSSLRTMGQLSLRTLWHELKRRRILDEEFDPNVEMQLIAIEQAMMMPDSPTDSNADPNTDPNAQDNQTSEN